MKRTLRLVMRSLCIASCLVQGAFAGSNAASIYSSNRYDEPQSSAGYSEPEQMLAPTACGCADKSNASCDLGCDSACDSNRGIWKGLGLGGCAASCDQCGGSEKDPSACDAMGCGYEPGLLGLGLIKKSDPCFNDFVSPMTNSTYFEDPRNLTEAKLIYINNEIPKGLARGRQLHIFGTQFRVRLTERLSLITTKAGYVESTSSAIDDGIFGFNSGFKYNIQSDERRGVLTSLGGTYETPNDPTLPLPFFVGPKFKGQFHLFATHGRRVGDRMHLISASGVRLPVDSNAQTRMMYWSNHADYRVTQRLYALTEVNWYNYLSSTSTNQFRYDGTDLFNFGASNVTGNNIVTQAVGFKYKRNAHREFGFAYEFPLTEQRDILKKRYTIDYIIRY